jgi:hypothetical protein
MYTFCRGLAVVLVVSAIATTPVSAQTQGRCTDQAAAALRQIGAWAEAQCDPTDSLAFASIALDRCSNQAVQGLRRIGSWAEGQCGLSAPEPSLTAVD